MTGDDETIREYLGDWPYVPHYLQRSLDHEMISRHGEAILRRALNTGRTVCFVGSGVSMSYGRLGWGEMVRKLLDDQLRAREGESRLTTRLRKTLEQVDLRSLPSVRYPALFQLGEELAKSRSTAGSSDDDENALRSYARQLLFDDRGHGYLLYDALVEDLKKMVGLPDLTVSPPFALPKAEELTRASVVGAEPSSGVGAAPWLAYFMVSERDIEYWRHLVIENFQDLALLAAAGDLLGLLQSHQAREGLQDKGEAIHLRPLHRFILPSLLRLSIDPAKFLAPIVPPPKEGPKATPDYAAVFKRSLDRWASSLRSTVTPPALDPLMLLADGLGISRFITTNYDLDLERLMHDRGFTIERRSTEGASDASDPTTTGSTDAIGAMARDGLFHPRRALELVEFSVHNPDHSLNVVHLHGRATAGDDMIITERDYQDQYLRKTSDSELVNTAISLAFGANPMLFVGSGMSEDDILRPLRQFLSERKSRADRRVVVLLPALSPGSGQLEETIAHYTRYGVFTLHYGYAEVVDASVLNAPEASAAHGEHKLVRDPPPTLSKAKVGIPWLALAKAMCRDLSNGFEEFLGWLRTGKKTDPDATGLQQLLLPPPTHGLIAAVRAIESLRLSGSPETPRPKRGWLDLLNVPQGPAAAGTHHAVESVTIRKITRLDGLLLDKAPTLTPTLELELMIWMLRVTFRATQRFFAMALIASWNSPTADNSPMPQSAPRMSVAESIEWLRILTCARALAEGVPNALTGLCLSAKLTEAREGWLAWKVQSEDFPSPRPNGGPRWALPRQDGDPVKGPRSSISGAVVLSRHPIALRSRAGVDDGSGVGKVVPQGDRFLDDSPSHSFRVFCQALQEAVMADSGSSALSRETPELGRRVFVLLAARGVGKGHFFEMLTRPARLKAFVESSWPEGHPKVYCAFASFNLSFCHEVGSVFDRLANVLVERSHAVFEEGKGGEPGPAELIWNANLRLKHNRVGRLERILQLYEAHAADARSRVLIAINGFNFLFDDRGIPKNAQLHRLVEILFAAKTRNVPVDFLLVCTDQNPPRVLAKRAVQGELKSLISETWLGVQPWPMEYLGLRTDTDKRQRELASQLARVGIVTAPMGQAPAPGVPGGAFFVHVLRPARASTTIAKYFIEVALAMAAHPGEISADRLYTCEDTSTWVDTVVVPGKEELDKLQSTIFDIAMSEESRARWVVQDLPGAMRGLVRHSRENPADPWPSYIHKRMLASAPREAVDDLIDQDFGLLFLELGQNRFLLTVVCAAASEIGYVDGDSTKPRNLRVGAVTGWLRSLLARRVGGPSTQQDDAIIGMALTLYRERHESRAPLPIYSYARQDLYAKADKIALVLPAKPEQFRENVHAVLDGFLEAMKGPLGWRLQQQVLWHLAVVGHPIEADVLSEAPKIQAACMQIVRTVGSQVTGLPYGPTPADRVEFTRNVTPMMVKVAMDLLVHRCLVFRLRPVSLAAAEARVADDEPMEHWDDEALGKHRKSRNGAAEAEQTAKPELGSDPVWRFALHRYVQRAIFQRLHSPYVEYPQVDQFSLSMWATQPDDLPRPNTTAARDIAELVAAWTGYPRSAQRVDRPNAYFSALATAFHTRSSGDHTGKLASPEADAVADFERSRSLPARMLRAAFGVVRSVYSVGVVSRYHEPSSTSPEGPDEGYFEQHRLQIRWLIQRAIELKRVAARIRSRGQQVASTADAPFFGEEIVWLYNECGLLSLVEGRMESASGLFRRALKAARQIEPRRERGALWSRVNLNLAIVDIERGHIRVARANLESIRAREDENPILRLLAHGLTGMTEQLAGNLVNAQKIYKEAIEDLEGFGQSRSIAIFSRQLGEVYRMLGPSHFDQAAAAIERALARATQGGHEDIRQLAKLSRVRLRIDRFSQEDIKHVQEELDAIERYGTRMGMPRLAAEISYARASYLLQLGETHYATTLAASSLEVSTANDLRLRQVTALSLLAKVCARRGIESAASPLIARADELAEASEYTSVRHRRAQRATTSMPAA